MDRNKKGKLSIEEIAAKLSDLGYSDREIERVMVFLVSGVIMYVIMSVEHSPIDLCQHHADENGFISSDEFKAGFARAKNIICTESGSPARTVSLFALQTRTNPNLNQEP